MILRPFLPPERNRGSSTRQLGVIRSDASSYPDFADGVAKRSRTSRSATASRSNLPELRIRPKKEGSSTGIASRGSSWLVRILRESAVSKPLQRECTSRALAMVPPLPEDAWVALRWQADCEVGLGRSPVATRRKSSVGKPTGRIGNAGAVSPPASGFAAAVRRSEWERRSPILSARIR